MISALVYLIDCVRKGVLSMLRLICIASLLLLATSAQGHDPSDPNAAWFNSLTSKRGVM